MDKLFSLNSVFTLLFASVLLVSWRSATEKELAFTVVKVCNAHDAALQAPGSCDVNSTNVTFNPNGPTMVPLDIHVANLVYNGNGAYRLPSGVPDMYVEFDNLNGQSTVVGPVTTFDYEGIVNNEPVYMAIVQLPFSFLDPCGSLIVAAVQSNARVITSPGQFYPIHSYSAIGDMFSCRVFSETCWDCSTDCVSANTDPQADFYFCVDCAPVQLGGGRNNLAQGEEYIADKLTEWVAEVRANPVQNRLVLDLSIKETTEMNIEIFTQTGVLAYQTTEVLEAGKQQLSIDTEYWQKGSYYCKVSSVHFSKAFTIMKM